MQGLSLSAFEAGTNVVYPVRHTWFIAGSDDQGRENEPFARAGKCAGLAAFSSVAGAGSLAAAVMASLGASAAAFS